MRQNRLLKIAITLLFIINNMAVFGQAGQEKFSFVSFEIGRNDHKVVLNWTVKKEDTSNYFEVERSMDGKNFKTIMLVLGPDPSKNDEGKFNSTDKISTKYKAYYRLKHINKEGIITFSPVKTPALNQ